MNLYIDVVMNLYSIITVLVVLCVPHVAALSLVPIGMWHINTKNIHKEWNCATNDDHCTTKDEHCRTNDENLWNASNNSTADWTCKDPFGQTNMIRTLEPAAAVNTTVLLTRVRLRMCHGE